MYINSEHINKIVIRTLEKPVLFQDFIKFLNKSPYIRQIAFIGKGIFDMPEFVQMVKICAEKHIMLIFGEMGTTEPIIANALVEYQNVIAVNIHKDSSNINRILRLKEQMHANLPSVNIIVETTPKYPQNEITDTSYAFYNLADDIRNIACLNMIAEPMIDYNGDLLGCWINPDRKHPINAFSLGMELALNHPGYKRALKMLRTRCVNMSVPCARCPVFLSLIWSNQTIDIFSKFAKSE